MWGFRVLTPWRCNWYNRLLLALNPDSLRQQPGPEKFNLFRIDLIYKAKKFKVLPLAI